MQHETCTIENQSIDTIVVDFFGNILNTLFWFFEMSLTSIEAILHDGMDKDKDNE